jgi:hypothetical protein
MSTRLGFDAMGATDGPRRYHDRPPHARKICAVELPPGRTSFFSRNVISALSEFANFHCRELFTQSILIVFCLAFAGTVKKGRDENGREYSRRNWREYFWALLQKLRLVL